MKPSSVLPVLAAFALMVVLATPAAAATLPPYASPLPLPVKAAPSAPSAYGLTARPTVQQLHPAFGPVTRVWGYDDGVHGPLYPGPTLEVQSGTPVSVGWKNDLPFEHLFPMDTRLTHDGSAATLLQTHLHGGFLAAADDGNPATIPGYAAGATQSVTYPNAQAAATLWYHDHAHGMTRLNVAAGLAGYYLVRDAHDTGTEPNGLGVPGGAYEIPLVIQDRSFDDDGQLTYPTRPAPLGPWVPEFFGDNVLVNGAVTPYAQVEPRAYRFRILNGSNARFYSLRIQGAPPLWQIGTDQGLLTRPVPLRRVVIAPSERADVVVDFSRFAGRTLEVSNGRQPAGIVSPAPRLPEVVQFRVGTSVTEPGPQGVPATLPGIPVDLPATGFAATRNLTLEEVLDDEGEPVRLEIDGKRLTDPVTETPTAGTVEEWRFVNLSEDTHPMHVHLTRLQVVDRWTFDVERYAADARVAHADGAPSPDPMNARYRPRLVKHGVRSEERGWKDTVRADPGQFTRIRMRFDLPDGVTAPQRYVFHCHILEHEENDMMRPYDVVP